MKAIIMAGGEGTRLRPLTCDIPKPMVKMVNAPIMEHCLRLLKKHGVTDIAVTRGYLGGKIESYFGSGKALGVKLTYFSEKSPLGTAGGVKNAAEFAAGERDFLVMSGSVITDMDLTALIEFHQSRGGLGTLALTRAAAPMDYGMVCAEKDGRISRFVEKPDWSRAASTLVSAGIYVLSAEVLSFIPENAFMDFGRDVFPELLREEKGLYGLEMKGYWRDIGDFEAYRRCCFDILDKKAEVFLPLQKEEGIWLEEGAEIEQGALLRPPVYIGGGSKIRRGARIEPYSVVGRGVTVSGGAGVKRSAVMDRCRVEENAQLRGAVIDEGVVLGKGSAVYEQAVVGRGSVIGENCAVKPTVKIWPQKELPADCVQKTNLIWGSVGGGRIWTGTGLLGELGTEITPETVSRLGGAMGTLAGEEKLAVSDCGSPAAAMLKNAFMGGALSTGARLYDFGEQPLPVSRSGMKFYRVGAGASINVYSKNGTDYGEIHVLTTDGVDPSPQFMAALRSGFQREDFARAAGENVCEAEYLFEYKLFYLKNLINSTKKQSLGYKLIVGCGSPWAKRLLKSAGSDLNCHVEAADTVSAEEISAMVKEGGADLGAVTDPSCQELTLIDGGGNILSRDSYTLLTAMIVMYSYENAKIYVPVSAPWGIEAMAQERGAAVVRTRNSPHELMRELTGGGEENMFRDQFIYAFDAVGALIKIMDFMKSENASLAELAARLPETHMVHTSVGCGRKAEVMEKVYSSHQDQNPDLTDGLKLSFDRGWVLILPSEESSAINITSQGYCEEYARELADMCVEELIGD